jgi:ketosteroid isomerase-like protein
MDPETIVHECLEAFEKGQFDKAAEYLADDMVFSGPVPQPIRKNDYVQLQTNLIRGLPDWKFNFHEERVQGDTVYGSVQISGNNTSALPAIMPGMQMVPVTGKHVSLPEEPLRITVRNGKITRIEADPVPGSGVSGILQQLGISMD